MDGFELCKEIRRLNEKVPILMLTALGSTDDKLDGFDAGADDYMTKPFDFRELTARVKVLLKRNKEVVADTPEQIEYADLTINRNLREVKRQGKAIKLSPKEYNLLLYMVENAEKVISRVEIAEKYGIRISIQERISSMCISITCERKSTRSLMSSSFIRNPVSVSF